ncbi:MAG TPA: hypothetical protein VMF09_03260 [Solirubrobacteraceae bacterium]|nr:hypothetical protein [Solirubrobacteraceae bacterium]
MASFLTPRMVFVHVPKTGGTWVTHAVIAAGVQVAPPDPGGGRHYSEHGHATLRDTATAGRMSVAFVRHPLDWWRSYWGHRMRAGWAPDSELDATVADADFNAFVLRVLDRHPGHFTETVRSFVGLPEPEVDFVGRYERLVEDTARALALGGERFRASALRAHPPENVNDYTRFPARYRPDVAARLAHAERETIERYYPYQPVPAALVCGSEHREEDRPDTRAARGEELESLRSYSAGLERTLRLAHARELRLELELEHARRRLDAATRAHDSLLNSRLVRYTRPLRTRYYAARERPSSLARARSPNGSAAAPPRR